MDNPYHNKVTEQYIFSSFRPIRTSHPHVWKKVFRAPDPKQAWRIVRRCLPDYDAGPEPFWVDQDVSRGSAHARSDLRCTGQYTQSGSDPKYFDDREPIATGAVERFSPGARKPKTRRRPRRNGPTIGLPTMAWLGIDQRVSGATIEREDSDPDTK